MCLKKVLNLVFAWKKYSENSLRRVMVLPFLVLSIQPVNLRLTRNFETNDLYLHSLNQ